ncbi:Bacterial type II secretion system protein F domain protein [compost metagenome]
MLFLVFLLIVAAVAILVLAFAKPKGKSKVEKRLKRSRSVGKRVVFEEPVETNTAGKSKYLSIIEARLKPFAEQRLTPEQELAIIRKLQASGDYKTTPAQFLAQQFLWAGILVVLWCAANWIVLELAWPVAIAGAAGACYVGYILPPQRLKTATEKRQNQIIRSMPTTLDLLTTCVEAGLSLQAAMAKVVELSKPHPLRDELERTLKEVQLGRPRAEALRELGKRAGLKELNSVAVAMVQAEAMGASIAKTLRVQSEVLREARWQRAQEMAQKATLKLTFPTVFLIFPTIFVIIFAPLLLSLFLGR